MTPIGFASACQAYCSATGGSVTSWGRTVAHNASLPGSVPDSGHLLWIAADVVYDTGMTPPPGVANREALAARLGLMLIHEGDHDHVQPTR